MVRRVSARGRLAAPLVASVLLAGCGSGHGSGGLPELTVALDFTPNAVHAPIYAAIRSGLDRRAGVRLRIRTPGQSPDSLKDVLSGAADLGILDIHDLGLAIERGKDVVAVAALVQRPLAAIIAAPRIRRPRDLEGQRVGVSGLPSDPAVLEAVMGHDGGDFHKAQLVTIGFAAVQSLIAGRIVAVPAFWNAEGVTLHQRGVPVREFRVDDYGAPRYPEVVLVTRRETLTERGGAVRAAVAAIVAGMRDVRAHPAAAVADIAKASGTSATLVRAQLSAVEPILGTALRRPVLVAWAAWDARFGILPRRPDVARTFVALGGG
jgi:NitT/TauT family transport system substrate-binding protein/putative hydroxymethylpyrimidine transport system substrate-binding protein